MRTRHNDTKKQPDTYGNIDTMNIFYTSSLDRSVTVKLGPVADRKCLSRIYHSRNIFYTSLPFSSLALDTGADIAAAGCILSLLLCGHHIYGLESVDQYNAVIWNTVSSSINQK